MHIHWAVRPGRAIRDFAILAAALALPASVATFATAPPAAATIITIGDVETLSRAADCILEAQVVSVRSRWSSAHTQIFTDVDLVVSTVHAGTCVTGPRRLSLLGGAVGDTALVLSSSPGYSVGERVLLFLDERPGLYVPTVGMDAGKWSLEQGAAGQPAVWSNRRFGRFEPASLLTTIRQARERR
ncbi:MAG: hypothetical protein ACREOU_14900 [Candidatus Eiseniibacteriota bacterium]